MTDETSPAEEAATVDPPHLALVASAATSTAPRRTSARPGQVRFESWMDERLYRDLQEHLRTRGISRTEWLRQCAAKELGS